MRILVSGGAGFIGSHLVDHLLGLSHEVWTLDNYSTGNDANLTSAYEDSNFMRALTGSVTWQADVEDAFVEARPHIVFHLAAQTEIGVSVEHPVADFGVNATGTVHMLEAAKQAGVRRFVFASTAAIFGDAGVPTALRMGPDGLGVAPISPYGAAKAAAMLYVDLYGRQGGMFTDTLVFSNVYGPRQRPDAGVVSRWAHVLLAGEPVTIHGDGSNVRDYVYVEDAVRALMWAAGLEPAVNGKHDLGPVGPTLVGTGVGTTDQQLLDLLIDEVVQQENVPGLVTRLNEAPARPGDIRTSIFPPSAYATTSLADGLKATVAAIRQELP